MAITISVDLVAEFRKAVIKYAEALVEGSDFAQIFGEGYNLNTIKKTYEKMFIDDLVIKGVSRSSARLISRTRLDETFEDVMNEIN